MCEKHRDVIKEILTSLTCRVILERVLKFVREVGKLPKLNLKLLEAYWLRTSKHVIHSACVYVACRQFPVQPACVESLCVCDAGADAMKREGDPKTSFLAK